MLLRRCSTFYRWLDRSRAFVPRVAGASAALPARRLPGSVAVPGLLVVMTIDLAGPAGLVLSPLTA
jgi:hypothetical protein